MRRRWLRLVFGLISLACLACVTALVYALTIQARAKAILEGVYALKVGKSSAKDVERLALAVGGEVIWKRGKPGWSEAEFCVDNHWLSRAGLEPFAFFDASVQVQRGLVTEIRVALIRDTGAYLTHPSAGEVTEYLPSSEMRRRWDTPYEFSQPVGKPYLHVMLSSEALPEQRRRAYAFSLSCLTKLGAGCDLPCDYLPLAWKDWTPKWENNPFYRGLYPTRSRCK